MLGIGEFASIAEIGITMCRQDCIHMKSLDVTAKAPFFSGWIFCIAPTLSIYHAL